MIVVVVCSIGAGIGLLGLVAALRQPAIGSSCGFSLRRAGRAQPSASGGNARRGIVAVGLPVVSGLLVGVVTRWPVAALLAAGATAAIPRFLRSTTSRHPTRVTEAVAVWTELLRDTLTASAGLAQSIGATAAVAPEALRIPVSRLADRIMSGVPMEDALQLFGHEVDNPCAYQVVDALRLAATSRAQRLVELLTALAESTREEVTMRLRVEASRASARSSVRTVIGFSLGFVALLCIVARSYLSPFGSLTGQLVLVLVGSLYVAGLFLMVRLVRPVTVVSRPRHPGQI